MSPSRQHAPRWLKAARLRQGDENDWLARALGRAGVMPRSEAAMEIAAGRVSVNGQRVTIPETPLRSADSVELEGQPISLEWTTRALMMNKPAGVICAGADERGNGTVFEALRAVLPAEWLRFEWLAIGRLDRGTTGLLLFTNDERLVAHVTAPATKLPKRYLATVSGHISDEALGRLDSGVTLSDGPARPARAERAGEHRVRLTLTEGRHHQVKRMLTAVGLTVTALHREAIGELVLDREDGEWRMLTPTEIQDALRFQQQASLG